MCVALLFLESFINFAERNVYRHGHSNLIHSMLNRNGMEWKLCYTSVSLSLIWSEHKIYNCYVLNWYKRVATFFRVSSINWNFLQGMIWICHRMLWMSKRCMWCVVCWVKGVCAVMSFDVVYNISKILRKL